MPGVPRIWPEGKFPLSTVRNEPSGKHVPARAGDPFAEIITAARKCSGRTRLYREALGIVVRSMRSPYGALHIRHHSEVMQEDAHSGPGDPKFWKSTLQEFLTESLAEGQPRARLLKSRTGEAKVALLSAPLYDAGGPRIGALSLVVHVSEEAEGVVRLATLEALGRLISASVELIGAEQQQATLGRSSASGLGKAAQCESVEEFAFAVVNELCNKLACNQVALATVEGRGIRIRAISGLDHIAPRTPGVTHLRAAMEECLDAGETIIYQPDADWHRQAEVPEYRLHKQWHVAAKGDAVASIPLMAGERIGAVLSLRRAKEQPLTPDQLQQVAARVNPLVPGLLLARKAQRSLYRHGVDSLEGAAASLTEPGRPMRKAAFVALVASVAFFLFGSMTYTVRVPCVVGAVEGRHVSAPFGGVLAAVHVLPGDAVRAGDVLAELDHRELDLELAELAAQWTVLEREKDRARALDRPAEVSLALANQKYVEAKLQIVRGRVDMAMLRAPIDGVVTHGDLRARVGDRIAEGEPLFQVAQPDQWKIELEVPEHASADISPGLMGRFGSFGHPDRLLTCRIESVRPAAELRSGERNVVVAEARIHGTGHWLRPGMEGVAGIDAGSRPVRWIVLHRVLDYLRLHFWL